MICRVLAESERFMGSIKISRTDDGQYMARSGADFCVANNPRTAAGNLWRFLNRNGRTNQIRFARPLRQTVSLMAAQKSVRPSAIYSQ